ncbi:MAG TPA: hypothetical protein VGH90_02695, partial [Chthoniobacteraceae bacterium]
MESEVGADHGPRRAFESGKLDVERYAGLSPRWTEPVETDPPAVQSQSMALLGPFRKLMADLAPVDSASEHFSSLP